MQTTFNIGALRYDWETDAQQNLPVEPGWEDNRSEIRVVSREPLFVQITQSSEKKLIGKTMACKTVDASGHGIKFLAEDFIPVGSLMDLWVDDLSRLGKYLLSGDVCWSRKAGKFTKVIGVRLLEGLATDIQSWKDVHQPSGTAESVRLTSCSRTMLTESNYSDFGSR
ncbi:MAG TPA: PilZ domain-containing protein [Gammaproteobacteria bacterium]|jgi:hypothetical protein|nr:PilZ domain-containing protein [Gammaproteobacteria bacterium]